jgi:hypothetical protein
MHILVLGFYCGFIVAWNIRIVFLDILFFTFFHALDRMENLKTALR